MDSAHQVAAAHWSARAAEAPTFEHWWEHHAIVRHVNRMICGQPEAGIAGGDARLLARLSAGRRFGTGVSVGCGHASKEMVLMRLGIVERFTLYEISDSRVEQGTRAAREFGLDERIEWRQELLEFEPDPKPFDLVYWNHALHHMLDAEQAVRWSRAAVERGGTFYMNDFVGANRFQWSAEVLDAAERVREVLPRRLLGALPTRPTLIDPDLLARDDPTEAADSAAILPAVRRHFPDARVTPVGGVVFEVALKGVLRRLEPGDADLLEALLLVDELHAKLGLSNIAVAVAQVPRA